MTIRTLYAIDSEALTVVFSTTQSVGDTVINNSDSPNGTQYVFGSGFSTRQITIDDTGGSADTLEDDNHTAHIVTDGAGLVANGTGVEAESVIQLQVLSASGVPTGQIINIFVLSQNGVTGDIWGFASDAPLVPGANYQKVGGGNIGSTDYANYANPWLVTVDGTAGNDVMGIGFTDVDGDQIDGSDGTNEAIYGYGGDDTITAGAGNDTLVGGAGADSLDGGSGIDLADYSSSGAGVTVNLATGTGSGGDAQGDTLSNIEDLTGSAHNDSLTGDGNANVLSGGGGNDTLTGGGGNDTLVGGAGADALDGGTGTDTADYSASGAGVTVNLASGTGSGGDAQGDTLTGIEDLTGSDFNDTLTGDGNANVLSGGAGNDSLQGGAGNDSLLGGSGNDTLIGGIGADALDGGTGTDRADYSSSSAAVTVSLATGTGTGGDAQGDTLSNIEDLTGSAHNDSLTGDGNANVLSGGGGTDTLQGGAGNDTLIGGTGADALDGGTGIDLADYSASGASVTVNLATGTGTGGDAQGDTVTGVENLTGSNYNDNLIGDGNDNVLRGGGGNDTLQGGGGNDTLVGGSGADALDGGTGTDTADYSASGAGVTVNLATGTGTGGNAQGDTLSNIENVTGSSHSDNLTGDGNANVLSGGGGNDTLTGGGGNDTLQGGGGNDTLAGGSGADALDGGTGTDTADYSASGAGVTVNLATGTATGGDAQGDTLSSIENVTGSSHSDILTGDGNANVLSGGGGNDTLSGGGGNDILSGGGGNDTLQGGAGNDSMTGGAGDDVFVLADGFGADTITDFDTVDSDGNGFYNDQLDVTNLTDSLGNPVNVWDVTVTDDGSGNALLTFPNGESILLQGVAPSQMNTAQSMNSAGIPCYAPGTLIDTPDGPRAVETLKIGDLVQTLDHGPQPIRWIRSGDQPLETVETDGKPVLIAAGALGGKLPAQDLIVSPQHRILVGGHRQLQGLFGTEAFAPAKSLTKLKGIRHMKGKTKITWIHFACDRHEVVTANGCLSESLLLGPMVVNGMTAAERQSVIDIFGPAPTPDAALNGPPALECLKVGDIRRQLAQSLEENGQRVANEIKKWEVDAAMEQYEAERLSEANPKSRVGMKRVG